MYAQSGIRLGVNAGLPTGDIEEAANFQLGADIAYRFNVIPLIDIGPMVGYSRFFLEDVDTALGSFETDDISYLPVAASGRLNLPLLFAGLDLGYAVALNENSNGGLYYRPQVGVKLGLLGIVASYSGISMDGGSVNSINLGLEFGL